MARTASDAQHIEAARKLLKAARTQGDAHPPVHLRLWRSFSHGWKI
jgi:hypothetical protein